MPDFPYAKTRPSDKSTHPNLWTPEPKPNEPTCEIHSGPGMDRPTGSQLPPRTAFRTSSEEQTTSVDPGKRRNQDAGESLETLLSPNYELPRIDPANAVRIDPHTSTSLVPEETAVLDDGTQVLPSDPTVRSVLETQFRHAFWKRRRQSTYEQLENVEGQCEVLQRFRECGSRQWVLKAVGSDEKFKLKTNKCKNRWCEACNGEKRNTVRRNLIEQLPPGQLRMLTFTLKANKNPLRTEIKRIYDSFKKWRKHAWFCKKIYGGIFFLEITYNHKSSTWHPHLHCLVDSEFLPQKEMRYIWKEITGDSFIVDIRRVGDTNSAAGEVAKYATKSISGTVWRHPELLNEAILALKGRRTFQSFGKWAKLSLSRMPDDETEWEEIGTLAWFIQRAQRGETHATYILNSIIGNPLHEPTNQNLPPP
jgi:Replication protein